MKLNIFKAWLFYILLSIIGGGLGCGIYVGIMSLLTIKLDNIGLLQIIIPFTICLAVSYTSFHWVISRHIFREIGKFTPDLPKVNSYNSLVGGIIVLVLLLMAGTSAYISNTSKKENIASAFELLTNVHQQKKDIITGLFKSVNEPEAIDIDGLSKVLQDGSAQVGETSETILVDKEGYLMGGSRFVLPTDTSFKIDYPPLFYALDGKAGNSIDTDYRGISVLTIYSPIDTGNGRLALLTSMDLTEAKTCGAKCGH